MSKNLKKNPNKSHFKNKKKIWGESGGGFSTERERGLERRKDEVADKKEGGVGRDRGMVGL